MIEHLVLLLFLHSGNFMILLIEAHFGFLPNKAITPFQYPSTTTNSPIFPIIHPLSLSLLLLFYLLPFMTIRTQEAPTRGNVHSTEKASFLQDTKTCHKASQEKIFQPQLRKHLLNIKVRFLHTALIFLVNSASCGGEMNV